MVNGLPVVTALSNGKEVLDPNDPEPPPTQPGSGPVGPFNPAERLDQILDLGLQSDKDALAAAGLTGAGQELMNIWNEMDRGGVKEDQAFEEADKAVRRRSAAKEI